MAAPLMIGSAILGGVQLFGGLATAMGMGERPRYTMTPEMRRSAGRAEYMAGMGFLPEERASAQQEAASTQMAGFRQAQDMGGGNLARSLGGSMAASNLNFQNRMAAQDAGLRRQNIRYADTFSREAQRLDDANTAADLNFRMQEERAVGQAMQSGLLNLAGFGNLQAAMGYNPNAGTVPQGGYQVPSGMFGPTSQYPDEMWATGGMPGDNVQTAMTVPSFGAGSNNPLLNPSGGLTPGVNEPWGGVQEPSSQAFFNPGYLNPLNQNTFNFAQFGQMFHPWQRNSFPATTFQQP